MAAFREQAFRSRAADSTLQHDEISDWFLRSESIEWASEVLPASPHRPLKIGFAFPRSRVLLAKDGALGGATSGLRAGISLPDGFRWKAILEAAITRQVTASPGIEGQAESPD
jgi:hypothetical protein